MASGQQRYKWMSQTPRGGGLQVYKTICDERNKH